MPVGRSLIGCAGWRSCGSGQGIDRTGVIAPDAMERTLAMTREYAALCREHGVTAVRFVATSASRDARNAGVFVEGVRAAFGDLDVVPEVVEGIVEAELSFTGATGGLRAADVPGPYVVVDLGGGSTELVRGTAHVEAAYSMDIGSVRMTERHLHDDPPTADQVAAARADVRAALDVAERGVRARRGRGPSSGWPGASRRSPRTRSG
jgi:exopolyphosphatase/guanosine-5'-triphosphate,3'-diphosphate pyrophosphatase